MYGFKPQHARVKPVQQAPQAQQSGANGSVTPFGSKGLNELRNLIPQMEAMGYPQAQPQDNRGAAGLKAIIPQMEAMGYKQQPQYFADGGFVQGIKRAFGMDEERNAQIAAYRARAAAEKAQQQAQAQAQAQQQTPQPQQRAVTQYSGMSATQRREKELGLADGGRVHPRGFVAGKGTATSDSIPARLSNGEYVLPADTVRAVGVEALDALRESTHQPVKGEQAHAARGFFAGGTPGGVGTWFQDQEREQEQRKQAALSAGQASESATQAGAYAPGTRGAQLVAAEQQKAQDRMATGNALVDAIKAPFSKPAAPATPSLTAPATQPAAPAQNPTDARLAAGTQTTPMSGSLNQPKPQPEAPGQPAATTAREVVPGVFNHGRGQYSDDPNGMNMPKGFTGQPSAANNAILQRMSDQSQAESMARVGAGQYAAEVQRAKNINADEAARNNSVGARMQRLADPFSNEGRAMRNLQMNIDSSVDRNGRPTAETSALVAKSNAMSSGYLAEPNQQRTIEAGLQREGMQQAGETARTGMREQGANSRAAGSNAIAQNEFGLRKEASGFQTRAAKRLEDLQNSYQSAKTPEERASIAQQLRELQGKNAPAEWGVQVTPSIKNADGSTTEGSVYRFNKTTGQTERVDGAGQPALPPGMKRQIGTSNGRPVYEDMNGKQVIAKG